MDAPERFWRRVEKTPACWLWMGAVQSRGYGSFGIARGKTVLAHRFAYELCVGPIPAGLTIDHVRARGCTDKRCVRPDHLEPVTGEENSSRYARAITHCKQGHPLSGDNLRVRSDGKRACVTCRRIAAKRQWEARP